MISIIDMNEQELEKIIDDKMDRNQPLQCWDLVKDLPQESVLRQKVWAKVKHAFSPSDYKHFYEEDLIENPLPEDFDIQQIPRFKWLLPRLIKQAPREVLDIGCEAGALGLTLGKYGIKSLGLNLYAPSIKIAKERSDRNNVPAHFLKMDFMDWEDTFETRFDAVVFFEILEHVPDPVKALKKAYDLVGSGGRLYISTPLADESMGVLSHLADKDRKPWDTDDLPAGHLRLFTEEEMLKLLKPYRVNTFALDEDKSFVIEVQK